MIDLTPILHHVPAWLMVVFRLTGLFILTPVLGSGTIPRYVKALLVLGLSIAVYGTLITPGTPSAMHLGVMFGVELSLWSLLPLAALELLIGYVIGYGVTLPLIGLQAGGDIINQQMGLGIAGAYNPEVDDQVGAIGQALFLMGITIFLILGGHLAILQVLVDSFTRVPVAGFTDMEAVVTLILGLLGTMMDLLVKVAAPVLTLLFLESVAMGFVARTVPQMNILSVGFVVRILMTAGLLVLTVGAVAAVAEDAIWHTLQQLKWFVTTGR